MMGLRGKKTREREEKNKRARRGEKKKTLMEMIKEENTMEHIEDMLIEDEIDEEYYEMYQQLLEKTYKKERLTKLK